MTPKTVQFRAIFYSKRTDQDGGCKLTLMVPVKNMPEVMHVESWFKKYLTITVSVEDSKPEEQGGAG